MADIEEQAAGNPSSVHRLGQASRAALERARKSLARVLGAETGEVIFTSGGTESNNLALFGLFDTRSGPLRPNDHVVTSMIEHPSVRRPLERLAGWGVHVTQVAPESTGEVSPDRVAEAIQPRTRLISVMAANNETGVLNDLARIGALAAERQILFHSDAVQAFGKMPINVVESGIHFLSASAHKVGGPKGVGLLYARKGVPLGSLHLGGSQENNHRGGTENVAGAVGFARAGEIALEEQEEVKRRLATFRAALLDELTRSGVVFHINGADGYPGVINLRFADTGGLPERRGLAPGQALMMNLDLNGIATSYGAACASGSVEPSGVLQAMGLSPDEAAQSLRFSFGYATTEEEVLTVARTVGRIVEAMSLGDPAPALPA